MTLPMDAGLGGAVRSGAITSNGDSLYVMTNSLSNLGNKLSTNFSQSIVDTMAAVGTSVDSLSEVWPDTAGTDATTTITSINDAYSPVATNVAALGAFCTSMAEKYETALQTAVDSIEE